VEYFRKRADLGIQYVMDVKKIIKYNYYFFFLYIIFLLYYDKDNKKNLYHSICIRKSIFI
jgi:hypothetical protein